MEIYKVTNLVNNKIYIGKTVFKMKYRKSKHISNLNTVTKTHYPLYSAIKKYGQDKFKWEVIDTTESEEELNRKEIYWIKYYDCMAPKGYNLTKGGDGQTGHKHSEETKIKISKNNYWRGREGINKGKKFSKEWKQKLSDAKKGKPTHIVYNERVIGLLREQKLGSKNPMYGKTPANARKVINLDTLEIYDNMHDVTKKTGIAYQNISKVCRGLRNKAGNFRWSYYDIYMSIPSQADESQKV